MGLIFDVLSAINNPKQEASVEGLGSLVQGYSTGSRKLRSR